MKRRLPLILAGLALFVLALAVRLPHLATESLWEDDWLNLDRALMRPADMFHIQKWLGPSRTTYDLHLPLQYLLEQAALSANLPLSATAAAKLPEVLAGSLTVVLLFFLGRTFFSSAAGLAGALLCAFSLYHVSVSRAIKAYAVLLLLFCASLLALDAALRRGGLWRWLCYAALAAPILYIAYAAVPVVAGQGLYTAIFLLAARKTDKEKRLGRNRQTALAIGAFALVGLCYLPWLQGLLFIRETFADPAAKPLAHLTGPFLQSVLAAFTSMGEAHDALWSGLYLGLAGLGGVAALRQRKWRQLAALLLPAVVPVMALAGTKTDMNQVLDARHFMTLFPALLALAGLGLATLAGCVRRPTWLPLPLTGLLAMALVWPNASGLPQLWQRTISYDKELAAFAQRAQGNLTAIGFFGYKAPIKAFAANWYLSGLYLPLSERGGTGYLRALVVQNGLRNDPMISLPGAVPATDFTISIFHTRADRWGIVNSSPLAVIPGPDGAYTFGDDYTGPAVYTQAARLENLAVQPSLAVLAPIGIRPGVLEYAFFVPDGVTAQQAHLAVGLRLYKRNLRHPATCAVTLFASRDQGAFVPLARFTPEDFTTTTPESCPSPVEIPLYNSCRQLSRDLDVSALAAGAKTFRLRLVLDPGREEGYLDLNRLRLTVQATGKPAPLAGPRAVLAQLAAKGALLAGDPDVPQPGTCGLFALATSPEATALPGVAGGPDLLQHYRSRHPGQTPVATLNDATGMPAVFLFDPALAEPAVRLSADAPAQPINASGRTFQSLTVTGTLDAPSIRLGTIESAVPVSAPAGSTLTINARSTGRLWWSPDFSKAHFMTMLPKEALNIRPTPDADHDGGLTCRNDRPCHADFTFVSAFPLTEVRLTTFPRVHNDPGRKNSARVLYSTNGEHFEPLGELKSDGSGTWSQFFQPARWAVPLRKPTTHLYLRLEMTGDGAQFWSHDRPIDRMGLWATLDTRTFAPVTAPAGQVTLRLTHPGHNDVGLIFREHPLPFPREVETP